MMSVLLVRPPSAFANDSSPKSDGAKQCLQIVQASNTSDSSLAEADEIEIIQEPTSHRLRRFGVKTLLLTSTLALASGISIFVPEKYAVAIGIVTGVVLSGMTSSILGPLNAIVSRHSWKLEHAKGLPKPRDGEALDRRYRVLNAVWDLNRQNASDHMADILKETRRLFTEVALLLYSKDSHLEELAYRAIAEYAIAYRYYKIDVPANDRHIRRAIRSRLKHVVVDRDRLVRTIVALETEDEPEFANDFEELEIYQKIVQAWLAHQA